MLQQHLITPFQSNEKLLLDFNWILAILLAAIMRSCDCPMMSDKVHCM